MSDRQLIERENARLSHKAHRLEVKVRLLEAELAVHRAESSLVSVARNVLNKIKRGK